MVVAWSTCSPLLLARWLSRGCGILGKAFVFCSGFWALQLQVAGQQSGLQGVQGTLSPPLVLPPHPPGDGCQVTPAPPRPLGNRTTTIHAHGAQKLQRKTKEQSIQ